MDDLSAIDAFAALAQSTRLAVFRLLVTYEPEGLPAGEIARHLAVPPNTMSAHLGILARAGLVDAQRRSRLIIYRARLPQLRALTDFLMRDCCGGRPDLCAPQPADLARCENARLATKTDA